MKTVILRPITEKGFCFDKSFVERVKSNLRNKKQKEVINEKICAHVVAEFLRTYEWKFNENDK